MPKKKPKHRKRSSLVSTFALAGAAILFWRGAWGLMDLYLFPKSPIISYTISLILSVTLLLHYFRNRIEDAI